MGGRGGTRGSGESKKKKGGGGGGGGGGGWFGVGSKLSSWMGAVSLIFNNIFNVYI